MLMYKALSNIKFNGKLYIKDDDINLPKELGKQLEDEGVVEILKETADQKKKREKEAKKIEDAKKKAEEEIKKRIEKYKEMDDEELTAVLEEREIKHEDLSREEAIEALERSDRVIAGNN